MIAVVDASAMIEGLVGRRPDAGLLEALGGEIAAPHLIDVELLSALRGLTLSGKLRPHLADTARDHHFALTILRHETEPLAERIWLLRHQFTAYDASYLALAEALDAPLLTCDARLATSGHSAQVRVFATSP